jgi:hypothetical protein
VPANLVIVCKRVSSSWWTPEQRDTKVIGFWQ